MVINKNLFGLEKLKVEAKKLGVSLGDYCQGLLINKGYIFNDTFGWEKLEVLKQFNLNPDMTGILTKEMEEFEYKESKKQKTDSFGKKTGEYEIERLPVKTGKTITVASDSWLNYMAWKKEQQKIEYAKEANLQALQEYIN